MLEKFISKLDTLQADERKFALAACACAPVVEVALRTLGLSRTLDWVERLTPPRRHARAGVRHAHFGIAPERAASIIDSVYRLQPLRGRCLPRALLQYGLQRRWGTPVRFVVGVKKPARTEASALDLDAHAWVEALDGPARSPEFAPILARPSERPQPATVEGAA